MNPATLVRRLFFAACLACAASMALAATYPVDDRASAPYDSALRLEWESIVPRRGEVPMLSGKTLIAVRLDVRPWQHRSGRLFMRLENAAFGDVDAVWATNGRLLAGKLHAGERALVYAGLIDSETLDDMLTLTLRTDARRLQHKEPLSFSFEIEVN